MRPDSLVSAAGRELMAALARATPPGAFAEVGVYRGGSAFDLLTLAREQGRELHLYDTFTGIPVSEPARGDWHAPVDFGAVDLAAVREALPEAHFHVGIFPDTFEEIGPVAFVHADADQFASTLAICAVFGPRMVRGGAILFDDYSALLGCRRAVDLCLPSRVILEDGRALVRF